MKNLYIDKNLSPTLYETIKRKEHLLKENTNNIKKTIEKTENNGLCKKLV